MTSPFQVLVQQHQERTYRAALRVLRDHDEALEVTQEAFLALHRRGGDVAAAALGAWLARVATHAALDRVRRRGRVVAVERPPEPLAPEPAPAARAETAERRARVLAALAALPERQRQVLTLRVFDQLTFPALAAALDISEGAAKVHFRRGLRALASRLRPEELT